MVTFFTSRIKNEVIVEASRKLEEENTELDSHFSSAPLIAKWQLE
jgi:hypothetical protein